MKTISVSTSKNYDVKIGTNILSAAGSIIREKVGGQAAAIVTDDNVAVLYEKSLTESLKKAGYRVVRFEITHGEASKSTDTFLSLVNFLASEKLTRTDVVIALGGGVPGDIAGFAAASYMRGIRFVQIPTTLLAAVDSSVGGKTAVNLAAGKNLLGVFYQPDLVLCDVSLLSTLPDDVFKDGCAEVIKYGIIAGRDLFDMLFKTGGRETGGRFIRPVTCNRTDEPSPCLEDVIYRCVKIKRDIVAEDEFEQGSRKLLNFGHTVGHAIELLSSFDISHGHAVAAGMAVETRVAVSLGICKKLCLDEILETLRACGLPESTTYSASELAGACLSDKKRDGGSITMVFPEEIGKCVLREIPVSELESLIQSGIGEL